MVTTIKSKRKNPDANKLSLEDRPAHDWYRFVLSYPPHLVRDYIRDFNVQDNGLVLDPFSGTGTTVVECKKLGIPSVGIEANPMAHFASEVKLDWTPHPDKLLRHAEKIANSAHSILEQEGIIDDAEPDGSLFAEAKNKCFKPELLRTLDSDTVEMLLKDSISPIPLHKTLLLLELIMKSSNSSFSRHERLALAKTIVFKSSNLHFGPEVGVQSPKKDAPVVSPWFAEVNTIVDDLRKLNSSASAIVHCGDARESSRYLKPKSVSAVITSPPYPNEKDYTRTTRLEAVLLGFFQNKSDIRLMKKALVRSNTRSIYVEDQDDAWVKQHKKIQKLAEQIEARRIELGKTSGFERLYHKVTKLYFGGMARHLADLRSVLIPGAMLGYVVGDQASYLRVMIRTGQLLGEIAVTLGYELVRIDLFRTRLATATKEQLREEVVVLRWPG